MNRLARPVALVAIITMVLAPCDQSDTKKLPRNNQEMTRCHLFLDGVDGIFILKGEQVSRE